MRVVIIGAQTREEAEAKPLVNAILDDCINRYGKMIVVTTFCDRGVGKIIKMRDLDPTGHRAKEFDLCEVHLRFWLVQSDLSKIEFMSIHTAINAMLIELGDEFHLLTEEKPKATMADLKDRIVAAGRPFATYRPSETRFGPKRPEITKGETP